MIRLLASMVLNLVANAFGLIAAAAILPNFSIQTKPFIIAVLIFTVTEVILGPLILKIALKNVSALVGGIALVTTFFGLLITNIVSDGISIHGISTWVLATLIVWIFSLIGTLLLPLFIFKKTLKKRKSEDG